MKSDEFRSQLVALTRPALVPSDDAAGDARRLGDMLGALADVANEATYERYKAVQRLRADGQSLAQIADALGISRGTAQRLVERGRVALDQPEE